MTTDHLSFSLPPREIVEPRSPTKPILKIYLPAVVLMMVLVLALNHHSSGVIGATISIGVLAIIVGVEFPLIFRAQDRRQQALMRDLPEGAFFAGKASLFPFDGRRRLSMDGTIVLSADGVGFSPKKPENLDLHLGWDEVSSMWATSEDSSPSSPRSKSGQSMSCHRFAGLSLHNVHALPRAHLIARAGNITTLTPSKP